MDPIDRNDGQSSHHPLVARLGRAWPPAAWADVTVLLAVSGGADSVAMLRAMSTLQTKGAGRLVVAHVNHGLRADRADADQRFVAALARQLDLSCQIRCLAAGQLDQCPGIGLEAAARQARYGILQTMAEQLGARYVATAHTADDQAETVLHHVLRGTGLAGLAGIPRARPLGPATTLIRPVLGCRRSELIHYLRAIDQPFRQDHTNQDCQYTRNAIRIELLPLLEQRYNPRVIDALVRLGRLAGEAQDVIEPLIASLADRCVTVNQNGSVSILVEPLAEQPRYVVRELLMATWRVRQWSRQAMGFDQWHLLADMLADNSPEMRAHTFPGGIHAVRRGARLFLEPPA